MDDAERYQKEFDLLMEALQAKAVSRDAHSRETIWKYMEKSFNALAGARGWTAEERESEKERMIQILL